MFTLLFFISIFEEWTHNIIFNHPPPNEYFRLEPIEQAAFLYYRSLYGKYHRSVNEFQTIFRREFYNHKSKGIDDLAAYIKVKLRFNFFFLCIEQISLMKIYRFSESKHISKNLDLLTNKARVQPSSCAEKSASSRISIGEESNYNR